MVSVIKLYINKHPSFNKVVISFLFAIGSIIIIIMVLLVSQAWKTCVPSVLVIHLAKGCALLNPLRIRNHMRN